MKCVAEPIGSEFRELELNEIDEVSGGLLPLTIAVVYTAGFVTGAGLIFGTAALAYEVFT